MATMPSTGTGTFAPSDEERTMVSAVVAGDRAVFERMMQRHNRRLYRIARAALRDDSEAEDALQEAYLSAFRSIGQFRGESSLSTWLSRLVLNECFGRMRRDARRQKVIPMVGSSRTEIDAVAESASRRPDRIVARRQMQALLERKLDQLPDSFRLVFVLRSVEELSVEETATVLGIPDATVRTRYFRAKSLLREALAQQIDLAESDLFDFGGERCSRISLAVLKKIGNASASS